MQNTVNVVWRREFIVMAIDRPSAMLSRRKYSRPKDMRCRNRKQDNISKIEQLDPEKTSSGL